MPMTWNVSAILALTGGARGLQQLLAKHGQAVPDAPVIAMWKARNRLPANWSAQVMYALGESQTTPGLLDLKLVITDPHGPGAGPSPVDVDDDLFAA